MRQGWDRGLLRERGTATKADFGGMDGFSASAPANVMFQKFGITARAVVKKVKALL